MKARLGFVSNSSSSSFVVPKSALTSDQIYKIKHYQKTATELLKLDNLTEEEKEVLSWCDSSWTITETKHTLKGDTSMDNFDIAAFMIMIGVPAEEISVEGGN